MWTYPTELLDALVRHGVAPTARTPPVFVRDYVSDLYRYELRRLRNRLLAGAFTRPEYLERVVGLRKQYWVLTLQPAAWEKICRRPG
jgi:hypothetical protein